MALAGDSIDWRRYYFVFLRGWWLVALVVTVVVGATWLWLKRQTPYYASRAVIRVEEQQNKVLSKIEDVKEERLESLFFLNTVVQSLTSNSLMQRVVVANGLDRDPSFAHPGAGGQPPLEIELAGRMRSLVTAGLRRGTRLIDVTVEHPDPEKARDLAASVVHEFIEGTYEERGQVIEGATVFLEKEYADLKKKLEESEARLAAYRSQNHDAVSVVEQQNIIVDRLKALNAQVTEADNRVIQLESDLKRIEQVQDASLDDLLGIPSVAAIPVVAQSREALSSREADFAALKTRYLEKHPKYIEASTRLTELRQSFESTVRNSDVLLRQQFQSAQEAQRGLHQALEDQKKKVLELDAIAIPYKALLREAEANRALFESVASRLKETQLTERMQRSPYTVVEKPMVSALPVRPNKRSTLLKALIGGILGGLALVYLLDRLDSSLRTVDQAEHELGLGALAALPDAGRKMARERGLVMLEEGGSSAAEAFRTLRASLSLLGEESTRRLFLLTSAVPAEGKTYTSMNLAVALARQGHRTLLIDGDLRRPQVSTVLLSDLKEKRGEILGFSDLLSGEATMAQALRPTDIENLTVLVAGRRAPNPAELLAQASTPALIQEFAARFDRVVIDSAPINAVSDTLSLAPHVHAVCLVVRAGKTPRRAVERAVKLLRQSGARIAGFVLNRVPRGRSASYYYYYYGDTYVKDGVYGAQPERASAT